MQEVVSWTKVVAVEKEVTRFRTYVGKSRPRKTDFSIRCGMSRGKKLTPKFA